MIQIFDFPITFAIIDRFCLFFARGKVTLHRLGWGRKISKFSQLSTEKMKMKFLQLRIRNVWMHKSYISVVPRPCQNQIYNYRLTKTKLFGKISWFVHLISQFSIFLVRIKYSLKPGVLYFKCISVVEITNTTFIIIILRFQCSLESSLASNMIIFYSAQRRRTCQRFFC